jgi:hypothetical protein
MYPRIIFAARFTFNFRESISFASSRISRITGSSTLGRSNLISIRIEGAVQPVFLGKSRTAPLATGLPADCHYINMVAVNIVRKSNKPDDLFGRTNYSAAITSNLEDLRGEASTRRIVMAKRSKV